MSNYRSKKILTAANGRRCVNPWCKGVKGPAEAAHYSGRYAHFLGKGKGIKAHDNCVAYICRECHVYFDNYKGGNDDERAAQFMLCVLLTNTILFNDGIVS